MTSPHEWQPGDEEVEKIKVAAYGHREAQYMTDGGVCRLISAVIRSSPYPRIAEAFAESRREHRTCEDSWYNCPASEEGSTNVHYENSTECTCGAAAWNAKVDTALSALQPPATGGE